MIIRHLLAVLFFAGLCGAGGARAAPVITEVAWGGDPTANSSTEEWLEVFNPGPGPICDLSAFTVVGAGSGGAAIRLPAVRLAENGFLVVQNSAGVPLNDGRTLVAAAISLTDGGEALCLCDNGVTVCGAGCDVVNAGAAWFAGASTSGARRSMERVAANNDGTLDASWVDGAPASPGAASFAGTLGDTTACDPAGEGEGEGDVGEGEGEGEGEPVGEGEGEPPPFVYPGLAITEVMFNPRASPEQGHEWIEIANLSSRSIDLGTVSFEQTGAAALALPARTLAPGDRVVLARDADLGITDLCLENVVVVPTLVLANSQTTLTLRGADFVNSIVYGTSGNITRFNGAAVALAADDVDNSVVANFVAAVCSYGSTADGVELGSPGVANSFDAACTAPTVVACVGEGEGEGGEGEGEGNLPDAGPNAEPTLVVTLPTGATSAGTGDGAGFDIEYDAEDPDAVNGGAVSVDVYLSKDADGFDGLRVARGLPGGARTRRVVVDGVPAGTWHVFAAATDDRGAVVYAYAPGTVDVGGGGPVDASFQLLEPDGVNDVDASGIVAVTWSVDLPADDNGTIALFLDTDADGAGGTPLAGGLPAKGVADEDGVVGDVSRAFALDTADLEPGSYRIYGVLSHGGAPITSVADGTVTVAAQGCSCGTTDRGVAGAQQSLPGVLVLAMLGLLLTRRILRRLDVPVDEEGG